MFSDRIPYYKDISLNKWIVVSTILFALLILAVAFNFGLDNQRYLSFQKQQGVPSNDAEAKRIQELFIMWTVGVSDESYESLKEMDDTLPLCASHFISNRTTEVDYGFTHNEFWFNFPNGSQVAFNRAGEIHCYIPTTMSTEQATVRKLVDDCQQICPGGISDMEEGGLEPYMIKE